VVGEHFDTDIPKECNVILGHTHFIKSVDDLYEALVESSTSIKFGIAFSEASGERLVRSEGNDAELTKHAEKEAMKIGAGHTFIIFLKNGYPVNVLNRIKNVSEVCTIHAATANPVSAIILETKEGRGVVGVIDGATPIGIETEEDRKKRREFIKKIGYKR